MSRPRALPIALTTAMAICLAANCAAPAAEPVSEGPVERPISMEERDHWSYRPLAAVDVPAAGAKGRGSHPVDRFLWAAMDKKGIEPLPRVITAYLRSCGAPAQ